MKKEYTGDGFEIVYISDYFFNLIEKELEKIVRYSGDRIGRSPTIALRDEPAQIEFRRLDKKIK